MGSPARHMGDNVQVIITPETEEAGIAGLRGIIVSTYIGIDSKKYKYTTPTHARVSVDDIGVRNFRLSNLEMDLDREGK